MNMDIFKDIEMDFDLEQVLKRLDEIVPPQPVVRFRIEAGDPGIFDSKIGGTPYFPRNMAYPCGKKGAFADQPLSLLAQLNFEQLPQLPDFPSKGILQFFIAADSEYGISGGSGEQAMQQENFRVIYHEKIITDPSQLLSAGEIPSYTGDGCEGLPFRGAYRLTAQQPELMPLTSMDYRYPEAFAEAFNAFTDDPIESLYDLDEDIIEPLYNSYDDNASSAAIGGYPHFTQNDPREYNETLAACDTVLFESDSLKDDAQGIDIMWGDLGIGVFLISRADLKARNFSRVLYHFDCG